jgi:hypothetical protein
MAGRNSYGLSHAGAGIQDSQSICGWTQRSSKGSGWLRKPSRQAS